MQTSLFKKRPINELTKLDWISNELENELEMKDTKQPIIDLRILR